MSLPSPPVTFSTSVLTLSVSPGAPSLAVPSIEMVTAATRVGVVGEVDARAAVDVVVAGAAGQRVVARVAVERVVAGAAVEAVGVGAAVERVDRRRRR